MHKLARSVLALAVLAAPFCAVAQTAPDLPTEVRPPVGDVVPGVGPTPGVILQVETPASRCAANAVRAADGLMANADALSTCNDAITSGITDLGDLTATFVNRGVLLLTMKRPEDARRDFDRALALRADTAEALVNRGAVLLGQGDARAALADLDRGIALGPERAERAYYQRAIARETLGDLKGAYADYKMADSLRPGWPLVTAELSRFRVVSR